MKEKPYNIITVSRQMGSGGTYIGYLAAKELGFKYLDREILRQAANKLGIEPGMLERYDGRSASLIENIVQSFCFGAPEMPNLPTLGRLREDGVLGLRGASMRASGGRNGSIRSPIIALPPGLPAGRDRRVASLCYRGLARTGQ